MNEKLTQLYSRAQGLKDALEHKKPDTEEKARLEADMEMVYANPGATLASLEALSPWWKQSLQRLTELTIIESVLWPRVQAGIMKELKDAEAEIAKILSRED